MTDASAQHAIEILKDLVAIPSVPGQQNAAWLDYVTQRLSPLGARLAHVRSPLGDSDGLIASIGPDMPGGIVLSGHMDVVEVADQPWSRDPFALHEADGRLYGRGATDMKGFNACALATLEQVEHLTHPIHIALSSDEESTCQSANSLAQYIVDHLPPVRGVLVGEPTGLRPVNRHKGSYTYEVMVTGKSAHAGSPHLGVSATALAARLIVWLDNLSAHAYSPEDTTHSIGTLRGGTANNIIAERCQFEWDIRLSPQEQLDDLMQGFQREIDRLLAQIPARHTEAGISFRQSAEFPSFLTAADAPFAQECSRVADSHIPGIIPAGTEAGLFERVGLPVMVMGPGDLAQAHIPDEFVTRAQIAGCMRQLAQLCV